MDEMSNKRVMAANIKRCMDQAGVNRKQVAAALQVPYSTVCEWVSGNAYPRIDKIERLARYFGVTKADLVEEPGAQAAGAPPRDVAKYLTEALGLLEDGRGNLCFDGQPLDGETMELLRSSLQNQLEMARRLSKPR